MRRAEGSWRRVAAAMTVAGWSANQFAPMLQAYRERDGLSETTVTALFGGYAAALIPTILLAGWWSQHAGKRPFVRAAVVLAALSAAPYVLGAEHHWLLLVARLLAGVAVGCVMGPGTAWVKELSTDATAGTGARRATVALSTGFGGGAALAGVVAQWLPAPTVTPYVLHAVLAVVVAVLVWQVPERDRSDHPTPSLRATLAAVTQPWARRWLWPVAPWVFGANTVGFVVLPGALAPSLRGFAIAALGLLAGAALGTGVLVQPAVRRLEDRRPGTTIPAGLAVTAVGMGLGILTVATGWAWLLPVDAVVLGGAYGMLLVGCLRTAETHVPPSMLAPASSVVYALAYLGFLAPYLIAALSTVVPLWQVLAFGIVAALVTLAWTRPWAAPSP